MPSRQPSIRLATSSFIWALLAVLAPAREVLASQLSSITVVTVGIYTGSSGAQGAYVGFSPAMPGLEGCTYASGNQLWIDFSSTVSPDGKALYATVLAAYLSGRSLGFGVSGCGLNEQYPLVYRVDVGQ